MLLTKSSWHFCSSAVRPGLLDAVVELLVVAGAGAPEHPDRRRTIAGRHEGETADDRADDGERAVRAPGALFAAAEADGCRRSPRAGRAAAPPRIVQNSTAPMSAERERRDAEDRCAAVRRALQPHLPAPAGPRGPVLRLIPSSEAMSWTHPRAALGLFSSWKRVAGTGFRAVSSCRRASPGADA